MIFDRIVSSDRVQVAMMMEEEDMMTNLSM
jgi:hypothetical protein